MRGYFKSWTCFAGSPLAGSLLASHPSPQPSPRRRGEGVHRTVMGHKKAGGPFLGATRLVLDQPVSRF
jgi:hypothetical protein